MGRDSGAAGCGREDYEARFEEEVLECEGVACSEGEVCEQRYKW